MIRNFPSNKNSNNISKDINNSVFNKENINFAKNIELNSEFSMEFGELRALWSELGVTETFRSYFENIALELDANIRKEYLDFEMINLKKLKEQIQVIFKLYRINNH